MIKLEDFIKTPDTERTKVKFNMHSDKLSALYALYVDNKEWIGMNSWRAPHANSNLDKDDYLIALAQYYPYGCEYFMFGGLFKVDKITPEILDDYGYKLTLMKDYQAYIKRLIIKVDKPIGRDLYTRNYENVQKDLNLEIYEILKPLQ